MLWIQHLISHNHKNSNVSDLTNNANQEKKRIIYVKFSSRFVNKGHLDIRSGSLLNITSWNSPEQLIHKSSPESSSSRSLTDQTVMKIPKGKKGPKSNLVSVQTSIIRGEEYQRTLPSPPHRRVGPWGGTCRADTTCRPTPSPGRFIGRASQRRVNLWSHATVTPGVEAGDVLSAGRFSDVT